MKQVLVYLAWHECKLAKYITYYIMKWSAQLYLLKIINTF